MITEQKVMAEESKEELLEKAKDFLSKNIQKFETPYWINRYGKEDAKWIDVSNNIDKIRLSDLKYFLSGGELTITLNKKREDKIHLTVKRKKKKSEI